MTVNMVTAPPVTGVFSRQYIDKVDKLILIFWHLIETYIRLQFQKQEFI